MLGNTLTAPELLRNKGIRFETWKKWDKTAETLPSKGEKQYEPNNSWLQNKQIEKGLKDRQDLLGIERVERRSQLAAAEWLPQEFRARVTKKSGQEWTSFGLEENLELYLIPEEALLLLELNCLELTWEGVALSIQQAYNVLLGLDQSKCSIDEYRVYSHLVRQGYRLQRFHFEDGTTPHERSRKSSGIKRKKLIHEPLDGFGINRNRIHADVSDEKIEDSSSIILGLVTETQSDQEAASNPHSEDITCTTLTEKLNKCERRTQLEEDIVNASESVTLGNIEAEKAMENHELHVGEAGRIAGCKVKVENQPLKRDKSQESDNTGSAKKLVSELYDDGVINLPGPSNVECEKSRKNPGKGSKVKIISDETLLGDLKIISKWPGTRIQRNVKLMPKRNAVDILPPIVGKINGGSGKTDNSITKTSSLVGNVRSGITGVQNCSDTAVNGDNSNGRKREGTQEVIELSDDEIEELPVKMSRMEMLNLFPNAISRPFVATRLSRRYVPHNVWPQKISNRYIKWKALNEDGKDVHASSRHVNEDLRSNISSNMSFPLLGLRSGNDLGAKYSHRNTNSGYGPFPGANSHENLRQTSTFSQNFFGSQTPYQRFHDQIPPWALQVNRGVFRAQEQVSVQFGIYTNVAIAQSFWGNLQFLRRRLFHCQNMWTHMNYQQPKQTSVNFMPRSIGDRPPFRPHSTKRYWHNNNCSNSRLGESSFKVVPGASSWTETKAKWLDEKTITIEDEDCVNDNETGIDDSEVEVVPRPVKPLLSHRNATSLSEVYKNLQIIKPATSENFRRSRKIKRIEYYRISYNLYPPGEHFKKANPGTPSYRIVVFRSEDTPFIELADIVSLQRDSKEIPIVFACVSQTSVTFAEIANVRIPEIQNNHSDR